MDAISKQDLIEQIKVLRIRVKQLEKQIEAIKEFYEEWI